MRRLHNILIVFVAVALSSYCCCCYCLATDTTTDYYDHHTFDNKKRDVARRHIRRKLLRRKAATTTTSSSTTTTAEDKQQQQQEQRRLQQHYEKNPSKGDTDCKDYFDSGKPDFDRNPCRESDDTGGTGDTSDEQEEEEEEEYYDGGEDHIEDVVVGDDIQEEDQVDQDKEDAAIERGFDGGGGGGGGGDYYGHQKNKHVDAGDYDDNQISIGFYIAFQPNEPSRGHEVTTIVTSYLNETQNEYDLYLRSEYEEHYNDRDNDDDGDNDNNNDGGGGRRMRKLLPRLVDPNSHKHPNRTHWDMFHLHTDPDLVSTKKSNTTWWWRYDLYYACFWYPSGNPITDTGLLSDFSSKLSTSFQNDVENGNFQTWVNSKYGVEVPTIMFTPPPLPEVSSHPPASSQPGIASDGDFGDAPIPESLPYKRDATYAPTLLPTNETLPPYQVGVDPHGWDWRRYAGLGVFVGTLICTCVLVLLASYRHRRLREQELWGCIGTEQGVDELLRTGWKIKGSRMEVYDKTKLGYDDDNSMFIGGYEQTEFGGCHNNPHRPGESSVTQPESEASPDTVTTAYNHQQQQHQQGGKS